MSLEANCYLGFPFETRRLKISKIDITYPLDEDIIPHPFFALASMENPKLGLQLGLAVQQI